MERVALLSGHNGQVPLSYNSKSKTWSCEQFDNICISAHSLFWLDVTFCSLQVWQMEWDVSGMTLATTGSDGVVRLWQSNLNGTWDQQALLEPTA